MPKDNLLTITYKTKGKLPRLPFAKLRDAILGADYELGIAVVTEKESRALNNQFRHKDHATTILSFSYTKKSGDLVVHIPSMRTQAPDFDMTYPKFCRYLFIHGMLHLKGMEHSSTMEKEEQKFLKKFGS